MSNFVRKLKRAKNIVRISNIAMNYADRSHFTKYLPILCENKVHVMTRFFGPNFFKRTNSFPNIKLTEIPEIVVQYTSVNSIDNVFLYESSE